MDHAEYRGRTHCCGLNCLRRWGRICLVQSLRAARWYPRVTSAVLIDLPSRYAQAGNAVPCGIVGMYLFFVFMTAHINSRYYWRTYALISGVVQCAL